MAKKTKESEENTKIKSKKKTEVAKKTTSTKKVSTKKSSTSTKKTTTKKPSVVNKTASSKKSSTTSKKSTIKKTSSLNKRTLTKKVDISYKSEYYDLPYMYNKTVVKVLDQTPKMLFIYWEISDDDKKTFKEKYGDNFFEKTRPVLIVYNDTLHYSFEVDINDFANSWYLHINDANCIYHVELGRRPYPEAYNSQVEEPTYIPYYIYLTSSNEMSSPNDKMIFNPNITSVKFRNVKNGQVIEKDINTFKFITNFGIFSIQELYKYLYPNEDFEYDNIVIGNTSSGALSSSGMFSSQFK